MAETSEAKACKAASHEASEVMVRLRCGLFRSKGESSRKRNLKPDSKRGCWVHRCWVR